SGGDDLGGALDGRAVQPGVVLLTEPRAVGRDDGVLRALPDHLGVQQQTVAVEDHGLRGPVPEGLMEAFKAGGARRTGGAGGARRTGGAGGARRTGGAGGADGTGRAAAGRARDPARGRAPGHRRTSQPAIHSCSTGSSRVSRRRWARGRCPSREGTVISCRPASTAALAPVSESSKPRLCAGSAPSSRAACR